MRKEIGSVLLILGIIVVMLSIACLIHSEKSHEEMSRSERILFAFKGGYRGMNEKPLITYVFLGIGIVMTMTGIAISVKQRPDKKRFFAVPIEYFDKIIAGFTIVRIFASGLLIWALSQHGYEYYTILRFVVFGATSYGTFLAGRFKKTGWAWGFGIIAILFNPLFPISLERNTWAVIDVTTAILLVVSIFLFRDTKAHD